MENMHLYMNQLIMHMENMHLYMNKLVTHTRIIIPFTLMMNVSLQLRMGQFSWSKRMKTMIFPAASASWLSA